jgi:Cu(I)/Ag(I) efflux system membrane fusion protein
MMKHTMKVTNKPAALTAIALLAVAVVAMTGCNKSEQKQSDNQTGQTSQTNKAIQYTCSMHPEVVQDMPGKCPKCGMELIEKH